MEREEGAWEGGCRMLIARVSWNRWRVNTLFVAVVLLLGLSGGVALSLMAQERGRFFCDGVRCAL